jgi:thioredoxin-dependent peroxiredoxin
MPEAEVGARSDRPGRGRLALGLAVVVMAFGAGKGTTLVSADELKVGDVAPAFTLPGSDGRTYSLADFKGKQAVVLAWFPKAFTGG